MSGDRLSRLILFSGCIWGFCLGSENLAQIAPDNTLGIESSIAVDDSALDLDRIVDLIKSGAIRGKTLFHSFEEFNVLADRQVYFNNPKGIEQIVTRVTGNNSSNILGRLGVNGNADLFLLNPNGILFGENASLDIGGSFVATTADSLIFDDDLVYSATNPEAILPLLNVTIPEGIQFGADAGKIEVRGEGHTLGFDSSTLMPTGNAPSSGLKVPTGKTLALIAGELNLNGGNLSASEGNIELAAIAQSGEVELEQDNNLFAFDYDAIDNFGDINLFQQSLLDARGGKNLGSVRLRGNNINLSDGSAIIASKLSPGKSQTKGKIELTATDSLNIVNNASGIPNGIFTQIDQSSNHPGADIKIEADRLRLQNNALIVSTITNKGQGGNININARQIDLIDNLDLPYSVGIYSQSLSGAKGDVGIITVEVNDLQLLDGQTVIFIDDEDDLASIVGENRAEDLEDAIEDNEDVNAVIGAFGSGKRSLILKGGGEITSINRGSGKDGVAIIAADTIQFFNTSDPEVPTPEVPDPEIPTPDPEIPDPEIPTPDPEIPDPEVPTPEVPDPEIPTPEPEIPTPETPEPEIPTPETPEPEIPTPETPEPEIPEPEVSEPEVSEPEVPDPEVPDISQDLESDRTYVFELSSGQTIVVRAEDLIKAAQLESTSSLANSSNSKSKSIEIYVSKVSSFETANPNFDILSGCRLGDDNFVIVGKGGIAENPFENLIQEITVPDIEAKLSQPAATISATELNPTKQHYVPVVEAQNWKLNQSGKIELLASSSQKSMSSLADLPNCLRD